MISPALSGFPVPSRICTCKGVNAISFESNSTRRRSVSEIFPLFFVSYAMHCSIRCD